MRLAALLVTLAPAAAGAGELPIFDRVVELVRQNHDPASLRGPELVIGAFQAFTPSYIISGGEGGPADSTLFYTLYLYQEAFTSFQMGYAAAMAWMLLAIIAAATAVAFISSRYWVFYGDADR